MQEISHSEKKSDLMWKRSSIGLREAGSAGKLVLDYLEGKKELKPFYGEAPNPEGFKKLLATAPYKDLDRNGLVRCLKAQASKVKNTSAETRKNIHALAHKNSYTVTTGHQLCLFGGPLYFIYKIASIIKLAEELNNRISDYHIVPVFWMASEDHDFAEINHFNTTDRKFEWQTHQQGAVGRFTTGDLRSVFSELENHWGNSENAQALLRIFNESYLQHSTLSDATRHFVNELFGAYGLVVIDGDDAFFKNQFRKEFRLDLEEQLAYKHISASTEKLQKSGYSTQVQPREVNCFLLNGQKRERIDPAGENYIAGDQTFSRREMLEMAETQPEKLSPNVSLRPLYQQKILPNISYTGGPGELAYWLQYKSMFDAFGIQFPILMPRQFITIVEPEAMQKLERYRLSVPDLFTNESALVQKWQQLAGLLAEAEAEKKELSLLYKKLGEKAVKSDPTLQKYVEALETKHQKNIDQLIKKINRANRQKAKTELERLRKALEMVKPGGVPQDRVLNFSAFFLRSGSAFLNTVLTNTQPFDFSHVILQPKN